MPAPLVKEHASTLASAIANLVNLSLQLGELPPPPPWAQAVNPVLKKNIIRQNILKHYRPVSSLYYVSMLVEKIVCQTAV